MRRARSLDRLPKQATIPLPPDAGGYHGRECPQSGCERYFKITLGTGLTGIETCRCPYCGFEDHQSHFHTKAQMDHAVSVIENQFVGAIVKNLKAKEFNHRARGAFGIGISMKVTGSAPPIRGYSEHDLETEVVCDACTLRYAIYGVFGYCPDCGTHNNLGILDANLRRSAQMLALAAASDDAALREHLVHSALGACVSAFDGWGRAVCEAFAPKPADPKKVKGISFQNISGASDKLRLTFGFDAEAAVGASDFKAIHMAFQKRHVVAHRMGVVDADYLKSTGDASSVLGRKVVIGATEVEATSAALRRLAESLAAHLGGVP